MQQDRPVSIDAQTTPTGINRANADASPTAAINGVDQRVNVDVAVIDTGADLTHPDLNIYSAGAKNCSIGAINANDLNGHGTHVSGTIGAIDNGNGVVGMAPGARIWPVKVLTDAGSGLNSDVICGIDYVTAHASQIEVANMSLGGAGSDDGNCGNTNHDAMHKAICRSVAAGITYAVAAGNDSEDAANSTPAAYDEVITVSALADFNGLPGGGAPSTCRSDVDDTFADYSNFGSDVDIIAPGVVHQLDLDARRLQHDQWYVDGQPARRRWRRPLQGDPPDGHSRSGQGGPAGRRLARLEQQRRR